MAELTVARKASYLLFAACLVVIAKFDLGPCLLAALVSYMILDLTERRLRDMGTRAAVSRTAAVIVFVVLATVFAWVIVRFLTVGLDRLPELLDRVLPRLGGLAEAQGVDFPAENARELRDLVVSAARENARSVGATSGLLTRGFFQVVAGVFVANLRFLTPSVEEDRGSLFDAVRIEFTSRVSLFVRSFERIVGAQFTISVVNTLLTGAFLVIMGFPFRTFLILLTFVCGLIPIVGNIVSNSFITLAGLTVSVQLAVGGLVYLVVLHKLEYLLNSRIVGGSIDTPMWMTLIGLVVGEATMGVPGVLIAPALLHYVREEMRAVPGR
ncbi:MAG: AI-2E family transporter [Elusimicrobiota bacterium]|nr:AI-2E family transporter [Elusimicrobiota bacterium]